MAIFLQRLYNKTEKRFFLNAVKSTPIKSKYTYFPVQLYTSWCMIEAETGLSVSIGFKKTKKELMESFDAKGTDEILDRAKYVYTKERTNMNIVKESTSKKLGCSIKELGDVLWQKQLAEKNGQTE